MKYWTIPKGYTKETRDEKFRWLIRNHYEESKFDFTHPKHGTIMIMGSGDCLVWGSHGDGTIHLLPMHWEGFCFNRFKNYVVSAWEARQKYSQQTSKVKEAIRIIKQGDKR